MEIEAGPFGLSFLLFLFGVATLLMPFLAFHAASERSIWFPFAAGFFLFALAVDLLCITQLFGFNLPHLEQLASGLFIAGFSLSVTVVPLAVGQGAFRRLTKAAFRMLLVVFLFVTASGLVRVVDTILLWIRGGQPPGPIAYTMNLVVWEVPVLGLFAGVVLLVFSAVLATASTDPLDYRSKEAVLKSGFKGPPELRVLSKIIATVVCLGAAVYGLSLFSDFAFGTAFEAWFEPAQRFLATLDTIQQAWDFYLEWAGFVFLVGILVWYSVSEQKWGCLTATALALAAYLAWAVSAGLFDDWGGPFRGAWQAVTGAFR